MQPDPIIYVIDDDEAVRDSLEFLLKSAGITVRGFDTAKAFLEIMPEIKSGCVITDVRMPEITGIDLLRKMNEAKRDLPVIVITGHGDIALAVEAMKIGAVDFLEKPFEDDHLLAAVRAALDKGADAAKRQAEFGDIHDKLAALSNRERPQRQSQAAYLRSSRWPDSPSSIATTRPRVVQRRNPNRIARRPGRDFPSSIRTSSNGNGCSTRTMSISNRMTTGNTSS